jgi:1-phosphofructokinase
LVALDADRRNMNQNLSIVTVTLNPTLDETLDVPGFAAGKVNRISGSRIHPGGKGVNVARVLADLGESVAATGFLGDQNPALFEDLFHRKKIEDCFLRIPGKTRVCFKIVDDSTGQTTDVNSSGLAVAPGAVEKLCQRIEALVAPSRWFLLCGSIPPGVPEGIYLRLIDAIQSRGGHVGLDASGPALAEAFRHGPQFAKPNIAELREAVGAGLQSAGEVISAARNVLLASRMRLVVVSMGSDGAVFVDAQQAIIAKPPRITVKSTFGAGDAMVAGIVYGLIRNLPLKDIARQATALGAHAVTGVDAVFERLSDYEVLLPGVSLESID